jgi:hypothetical protein
MTDDLAIDKVVALWQQASDYEEDAKLLESEAKNKRMLAAELYDMAEQTWKPLAANHPEWRDAFVEERDPRDG